MRCSMCWLVLFTVHSTWTQCGIMWTGPTQDRVPLCFLPCSGFGTAGNFKTGCIEKRRMKELRDVWTWDAFSKSFHCFFVCNL